MLMSSLYELIDKKEEFLEKINNLGLPSVRVKAYNMQTNGISGTHISIRMSSKKDKQDQFFEKHHYMTLESVKNVISTLTVSPWVQKKATEVYTVLAGAEAVASYGRHSAQTIHFHSLGFLTSIANIVGVCMLMEEIKPQKVIVSPICTGYGKKDTYYGRSEIPLESTRHMLSSLSYYEGDIEAELCTRKGAALLKVFADSVGEMPDMENTVRGCGIGKMSFDKPNCVMAHLGDYQSSVLNYTNTNPSEDVLVELKANIDNINSNSLSYVRNVLLQNGAEDVYTVPIFTATGEQGIMLCCLCNELFCDDAMRVIFENTSATRIRKVLCNQYVMGTTYEKKETKYGSVNIVKSQGFGVKKVTPTINDIEKISMEINVSPNKIYNDIIKDI